MVVAVHCFASLNRPEASVSQSLNEGWHARIEPMQQRFTTSPVVATTESGAPLVARSRPGSGVLSRRPDIVSGLAFRLSVAIGHDSGVCLRGRYRNSFRVPDDPLRVGLRLPGTYSRPLLSDIMKTEWSGHEQVTSADVRWILTL